MAAELPLDELSTIFARLNSMLLTEQTVDSAVIMLADAAKLTIPEAVGAGTTTIDDAGHQMSTGSTDHVVREADELQYSSGEGPCLSAWASSKAMRIDDVDTDPRWPQWSNLVGHLPIRSVLSVPLIQDDAALGAMKIYSASSYAFTDETQRLLTLLAGPAAALLSHIQSHDLPTQLTETLQTAMASRDTINVAKGIIMSQHELSSDDAMRHLIRTARRQNQTLFESADQIIAAGRREDR